MQHKASESFLSMTWISCLNITLLGLKSFHSIIRALISKSLYMIKQAYSNVLDQKAKNTGIDKT